MNNLQSRTLEMVTTEIKMLEQSMKKSMVEHAWEIGKRLVEVKDDLGHRNFGEWISGNFEFTWQYANQFMLFYKQNPNYKLTSNLPSWSHVVETLYLPESIDRQEFVGQAHTIPSTGESKTVDEMTVKELREVKKALKDAEQAKQQAETKANDLAKQLEQERSKQPQVIEKEVVKEIVPENVRKELNAEKSRSSILSSEIERLTDKIKAYEVQEIDGFNPEVAEIKRKRLEMESEINALQIRAEIKNFLQRNAVTAFAKGMLATADKGTKQKIFETITALEEFIDQIKESLNGTMIIQEAQYEEVM